MNQQELSARKQNYKAMASTHRLGASMLDLAAAASAATIGMQRLADLLAPMEEWDDIILEDILDAECISDD